MLGIKRYISILSTLFSVFGLCSCTPFSSDSFNGDYLEPITKNKKSYFDNQNKISYLSDEFDDSSSLSNWNIFNQINGLPQRINTIDINNHSKGNLYLNPYPAAWYGGYHGVFLYKKVKGNFIATTRIKVIGKRNELPKDIWSTAGLMIREPDDLREQSRKNKENWVYLMTGRGSKENLVIDWKSVRNNEYYYVATERKKGWLQLGIVRIGPMFIYIYKYDNEKWKIGKRRYIRSDLPIDMQIGISATADIKKTHDYTFDEFNSKELKHSTDLLVYWDYFRIRRPTINENIIRKIISQDFVGITDNELILIVQ